ncbi:hypothetical protein CONPUDRAFT_137333 [Coniophora puteana RWD-64-598 SS2]|uniref:CFA20 domain-containing protein n=1 Tax=Coniophora puteana (strain RWD-64-598) TaxID=741705 RepID=A0A5M3MQI2_CONPW|nr:uncharacterized protein CONPUDRAFT_137333 [Coniophora puteana RWD-64-598 SS2]EIW81330.1 hypothetical protein CONPUDRAFT_137333 [Coniophora puteana RWD-64-598 SS2]
MFADSVQPPIVSLFSSTGSNPLSLFSVHTDDALPSDSFVHLLDDATSLPNPPEPASPISLPQMLSHPNNSEIGHELRQTVLHIQSPTLRTTSICCPPHFVPLSSSTSRGDLGLRHEWLHMQVRNVGREWSFEVGIVDSARRLGIIRCSTFQTSCPTLHLPLAFPAASSNPLTHWADISLHLPSFIPHFSLMSLRHVENNQDSEDEDEVETRAQQRVPTSGAPVPSGKYSHIAYVRIFATCRLRRIWFSDSGNKQGLPWEFQLYGQ